ncbi:MAG: hypothetical protein NW202_06970 [Nitrospira sp.]|nr:hypothetical protein [Nitrospira sp.]
MPKRSNDFQRLVYSVHLNLAAGAEVKESHMMQDRLTKRFREVDVVIKGKVGSQPVVVCVECRDHKRVADVTWVDAMKTKHERLDTHVLLLASSKGFTKEAEDVARKYGIELFTLERQETADMAGMLGPSGSLWHKTYSLSADKVSIRVSQTGELPVETVATSPDNLLYLEDGSELCQVKELVDQLLMSEHMRDFFAREGKEEHKRFELIWAPPADHLGRPLYMQKLEPKVLRAVELIRIVGSCSIEIGRFGLHHGRLGTIQVAWGKTTIGGRDVMAVATKNDSGETRLSINFKGAA